MTTLFSEAEIAARVEAVAAEIAADLGAHFVLAPILTGGFVLGADLARALSRRGADPEIDFVQLASYGHGRESSGIVRVIKDFSLDLSGKTVLLIDDVLDSGRSIAHAAAMLEERGAARIAVAVAVRKDKSRSAAARADYALFDAPGDAFLVGYGMDDRGLARARPDIGTIG